jgi:hypothetical protein
VRRHSRMGLNALFGVRPAGRGRAYPVPSTSSSPRHIAPSPRPRGVAYAAFLIEVFPKDGGSGRCPAPQFGSNRYREDRSRLAYGSAHTIGGIHETGPCREWRPPCHSASRRRTGRPCPGRRLEHQRRPREGKGCRRRPTLRGRPCLQQPPESWSTPEVLSKHFPRQQPPTPGSTRPLEASRWARPRMRIPWRYRRNLLSKAWRLRCGGGGAQPRRARLYRGKRVRHAWHGDISSAMHDYESNSVLLTSRYPVTDKLREAIYASFGDAAVLASEPMSIEPASRDADNRPSTRVGGSVAPMPRARIAPWGTHGSAPVGTPTC